MSVPDELKDPVALGLPSWLGVDDGDCDAVDEGEGVDEALGVDVELIDGDDVAGGDGFCEAVEVAVCVSVALAVLDRVPVAVWLLDSV